LNTEYPVQQYFGIQTSFYRKEYVCNTCNSKVKRVKFLVKLRQTTCDDTPVELASLETEKLEQVLKAQRILFEKIIVMPLGSTMKSQTCNLQYAS